MESNSINCYKFNSHQRVKENKHSPQKTSAIDLGGETALPPLERHITRSLTSSSLIEDLQGRVELGSAHKKIPSTLREAVIAGDIPHIDQYLPLADEPSKREVLHFAIMYGHGHALKHLLTEHFDIVSPLLNVRGTNKRLTPVNLAIFLGKPLFLLSLAQAYERKGDIRMAFSCCEEALELQEEEFRLYSSSLRLSKSSFFCEKIKDALAGLKQRHPIYAEQRRRAASSRCCTIS